MIEFTPDVPPENLFEARNFKLAKYDDEKLIGVEAWTDDGDPPSSPRLDCLYVTRISYQFDNESTKG